jgi:hypothetical protein
VPAAVVSRSSRSRAGGPTGDVIRQRSRRGGCPDGSGCGWIGGRSRRRVGRFREDDLLAGAVGGEGEVGVSGEELHHLVPVGHVLRDPAALEVDGRILDEHELVERDVL